MTHGNFWEVGRNLEFRLGSPLIVVGELYLRGLEGRVNTEQRNGIDAESVDVGVCLEGEV
eukprot:CAMPEP_0171655718 /NCGR_PEP_ID=MMETSP0990-20121206/41075_1 /TAXON_ID=483369 /ORGANISM="non described non described, Strain CCMP2098" /LENGTH=59 /DNA_ID=CAMNT_0012235899 /DNA_START=34 /DNA_END=214 /DNA_ORIENTATION=+